MDKPITTEKLIEWFDKVEAHNPGFTVWVVYSSDNQRFGAWLETRAHLKEFISWDPSIESIWAGNRDLIENDQATSNTASVAHA